MLQQVVAPPTQPPPPPAPARMPRRRNNQSQQVGPDGQPVPAKAPRIRKSKKEQQAIAAAAAALEAAQQPKHEMYDPLNNILMDERMYEYTSGYHPMYQEPLPPQPGPHSLQPHFPEQQHIPYATPSGAMPPPPPPQHMYLSQTHSYHLVFFSAQRKTGSITKTASLKKQTADKLEKFLEKKIFSKT